ncbi:MAG TPA: ClpXP protease specificity-enhancing factor SspB [Myxococcaceae bacterium]|nr:ClpXP protease specificity-enhancing factor SspB [Myxococcaceae bacterium]
MDNKAAEKKSRLLAALENGMVMIHLDARRPGVLVPEQLRGEFHLRLNLSYNFDPPDLAVGEWGVRSTLSFKGSRFKVAVPWSAVFAVTSNVTKDLWLFPDDIPAELQDDSVNMAAQAQRAEQPPPEPGSAHALLREITQKPPPTAEEPKPDEEPKPRGRGHLRVVK